MTTVINFASAEAPSIRATMASAVNPRIAAGLSCGPPIMPGTELVSAVIICMISPPNKIIPMPVLTNGVRSSAENIRRANEIASGRPITPPTKPMLAIGSNSRILNGRDTSGALILVACFK